ncbi:hypothetical protein Deima_0654 [Deinococcus maricopensis DSM 21211]|uniref:Uncharacterized protein n=2 Tax=Deinococcus TaxID=1298 RepID=E8U5H2_DEIML|nr:hypothetical protein Deima_0654 [Deinococcus maricopensis DSM 21211]
MRLLGDLISPKALERILQDAARARGQQLETLDEAGLSDILKREVFKRLQLSVPAPLAKRRVQEVLTAIGQEAMRVTQERPADVKMQVLGLEDTAKRFALYFDWPELQRLRSLLNVARDAVRDNQDVTALLAEGNTLAEALERRLQEGLVAQASDLAEIRAALPKLSAVGGPKLRRLETLTQQIDDAQKQETLLPAEVERARKLVLDLRKLVESSVVSAVSPQQRATEEIDLSMLPAEAVQRLQELERQDERRALADLVREYEPLLRVRADLDRTVQDLRARQDAGGLLGEDLSTLRVQLGTALRETLNDELSRLKRLEGRLEDVRGPVPRGSIEEARLSISIARGTLEGGALASDEVARLEGVVQALEHGQNVGDTERLIAVQRETYELERAARDVPGASELIAPGIAQARVALERGQIPSLDDLWATLERRMGEAAQQRENFDERADRVIGEYDQYRSLAGETIQRLGRAANVLRAQRRLGTLSREAREQYAQTITDAEALLDEARAEFEAARQVTATFGSDALSDLLGVFDAGGDDLFGGFGGDDSAPTPTTFTPTPPVAPSSPFEGLQVWGAQVYLVSGHDVTFGGPEPLAVRVADAYVGASGALGGGLMAFEGPQGAWLALGQDGGTLVLRVPAPLDLDAWRARLSAWQTAQA